MITISHSHADGTLIEGSRKGDGVFEILKAQHANWRWFPSIGQLGIGQSRDKNAKTWVINRAAEALRAAGFEVSVEIDEGEARTFAEQEAERYERAEERADRHGTCADNAAARSAAAYEGARQIADGIPFGQPVLVGHHSEGRHRRALARMDNGMRKSIDEDRKAGYHADRAESAEHYQQHRENVPVTLRRIEKLEADARRVQRSLDGRMDYVSDGNGGHKLTLVKPGDKYRAQLERRAADLAEEVAYWRALVAKREAEEGVKVWTRADFTKGDFMRFRGTWYEVVRVSGKSVTIPAMINDGPVVYKDGNRCTWTDTIPYHEVTGRKSAAEIAAALAAAEEEKAS